LNGTASAGFERDGQRVRQEPISRGFSR